MVARHGGCGCLCGGADGSNDLYVVVLVEAMELVLVLVAFFVVWVILVVVVFLVVVVVLVGWSGRGKWRSSRSCVTIGNTQSPEHIQSRNR